MEQTNARKAASLETLSGQEIIALVRRHKDNLSCVLEYKEVRTLLSTLDRLIARERNKGVARHWSYDLNRHIALKNARTNLRAHLQLAQIPDAYCMPTEKAGCLCGNPAPVYFAEARLRPRPISRASADRFSA